MFENYNIFYSSRFGDLERVKYLIGIEGIDVNIREPGYVIKYSLHSQFSVIYCLYFFILLFILEWIYTIVLCLKIWKIKCN